MTSKHSTDIELRSDLKEQLRLFVLDDSTLPAPDVLMHIRQELSKHARLAALLEGELNFHGENSGYASHDLHAFAAKFPPQLPRAFIRGLTNPDDIVLDPMMGSGTTVVEALIEGRKGFGLDIDPLALRLCRVKTTPLDIDRLRDAGYKMISRANVLLTDGKKVDWELANRFDEHTKAFIDYWFLPTTQRELMALVLAIKEVDEVLVRQFLELTFSSIIITKSGGVSRARDLAHSRPHLDKTKSPKNALEQCLARLRKNLHSIAQLKTNGTIASLEAGDARSMPFMDKSIDLIVTSPPYANAIDYMRAHKFSLVWFGESVADLSELRADYIGSERIGNFKYAALPDRPETIIRQLMRQDSKKAAILRKYFVEMQFVISEMYRVLRSDSAAIIIVGTSVMRGIDVQTHYCLADIADKVGFDVVGVVQRVLDRNKRMMPARFGKKTDSMIEQRMHEEYVIGLLKPERS
jgi:DNA modification methylase